MDLQRALSASKGDFVEVKSQVFIDAQVNEKALQEARRFLSQITEHDILVMFVAWHGLRGDDAAHTYYYLDHDTDLDNLEEVSVAELTRYVKDM